MISDKVRLTSIGVRITAPFTRSAAARMSSMVGGCIEVVWSIAQSPSPSAGRKQCYAAVMIRPAIALAALLLASAASADTLFTNVNGIQVGADGKLDHFKAFVVGNDGRIVQLLRGEDDGIVRHDQVIDAGGRTVLPGLIDAHGHVVDLGFA